MASRSSVLIFTPTESLKHPEAHTVISELNAFVLAQAGSTEVTALVLDLVNVEFLDYTGVQVLLAVKDFLAEHTGRHVPIHFYNAKPDHINRLARVSSYIPESVSHLSSPTMTPRTSVTSTNSSVGSSMLERQSSPTEHPPRMIRARSSSLALQNQNGMRRGLHSSPNLFPQPSSLSLKFKPSNSNLSENPHSHPTTPVIRSKSSNPKMATATTSAPVESTQRRVEMKRTNSVGSFMKTLPKLPILR
ncbi:UNVERIFIED_CONTAM: hypothetical protein HDU68_008050 [Siphonaria sp. JEL0065]|nr:hypothetical protein HDU68_008050 [Siphonaria sp. JEL0065]